MGHLYNGILLSHKMNEIMPSAATHMDPGIILLSEASQAEKDTYHMISLIGGSFRKQIQMNLYTKQTHRHRK